MSDRKTPPMQRPQRPNRQMAAPAPDQMPRPPSFRTQSYESFVGRSPTPPPHSPRVDPNRRSAPVIQRPPIEQLPPTRADMQLSQLGALSQQFAQEQSTLILQGERDLLKAQLRAKLSIIAGEQLGEEYILNRALTQLGRALENDIVLIDIAASRRHLEIKRHDQGFALKDLNSANGVSINGRRVLDDELYDGDVIEVGETRLHFETVGGRRTRPLEEEQDTDPGLTGLPAPTVARTREVSYKPPSQVSPPTLPTPPLRFDSAGVRVPHSPPATPPTPQVSYGSPPPPEAPPPIPAPLATTSAGFGGSVDSATIERLATPNPAQLGVSSVSSRLPFAPPSWGAEGEDLIELEPIPEVPEEDLGGKPKPQNPWKTMGLGGLSAQDLGFKPEKKKTLEQWAERGLTLWDSLMVNTGLDRVPAHSLIIISVSLVASLTLGLLVGRLQQLSGEEYMSSIQGHVARGELPEAQALLQRAEAQLEPEEYQPLQVFLNQELKWAEARRAFKEAFKQEKWSEGLKIILEQLPANDPEVLSLSESIIKIKLHVLQEAVMEAHHMMWRGQLGSAHHSLVWVKQLYREGRFMIESALIDAQVKRLDFALALHAERLGFQEGEPILSSPPSDQKSLAESAQAARDGQLDQAIQILKSAMPSTKVSASTPLRRRLFQVRLSSLERLRAKRSGKKERAKTLDQLFLEEGDAYLLASEELAQAFAFYLKALRGAIKKAQYPIVARCLSYAELLSPQDAQVLSYRQRLTSKATEWLQMAKEHQRNGQLKEARLLVSTAILFLRDELKTEAMMLKASLP